MNDQLKQIQQLNLRNFQLRQFIFMDLVIYG